MEVLEAQLQPCSPFSKKSLHLTCPAYLGVGFSHRDVLTSKYSCLWPDSMHIYIRKDTGPGKGAGGSV